MEHVHFGYMKLPRPPNDVQKNNAVLMEPFLVENVYFGHMMLPGPPNDNPKAMVSLTENVHSGYMIPGSPRVGGR